MEIGVIVQKHKLAWLWDLQVEQGRNADLVILYHHVGEIELNGQKLL